jgi:small conductance mechanosensitive channel
MQWEKLSDSLMELGTVYGLKLVYALAILIIGRWVAKLLRRLIFKMMGRTKVDNTVSGFVANIAYAGIFAFVVIAALGQLGIQTASFIAVLGAAGLAIGLALQGSLANFAAGFLMILFRPFKVGDYIEGGGTAGIVEEIQLFTTQLRTGDNKVVIVPNGSLVNGNIVNYSAKETRRVDLTVGVSYDADLSKVRTVLSQIIDADERVLREPEPLIAVAELAESSVNFVVRIWVKSGDYWGVLFDTNEKVKVRFDAEGIGIPFPQRDIHVFQHRSAA